MSLRWNKNKSVCGNYFIDYRKSLGWTVYRQVERGAWAMLEPGKHHKTRDAAIKSAGNHFRKYGDN